MELQHIRILETGIILLLYVVSLLISRKLINNTLKKAHLERTRRKIIIKAINLFLAIGVLVLTASVWGLEQRRVAVFAGTIHGPGHRLLRPVVFVVEYHGQYHPLLQPSAEARRYDPRAGQGLSL
jgi:hypothetical protein